MNTTAELVKTSKIQFDYHTAIHNERVLEAIGKTDQYVIPKIDERCLALKDSGFHCFVGRDIEAKFKYKAGLNGSLTKTVGLSDDTQTGLWLILTGIYFSIPPILAFRTDNLWFLLLAFASILATILTLIPLSSSLTKTIDYIGDIPDFVLANLDKAKECGLKDFKIYSCEPLPVKQQLLLKVDPVMIGWINDDIGVVVGIWDRDKEVTI